MSVESCVEIDGVAVQEGGREGGREGGGEGRGEGGRGEEGRRVHVKRCAKEKQQWLQNTNSTPFLPLSPYSLTHSPTHP